MSQFEFHFSNIPFIDTEPNYMLPVFTSDPQLKDLIAKLLSKNPDHRMCNIESLKLHSWFGGIDWDILTSKNFPKVLNVRQSIKISECASNTIEEKQRVFDIIKVFLNSNQRNDSKMLKARIMECIEEIKSESASDSSSETENNQYED